MLLRTPVSRVAAAETSLPASCGRLVDDSGVCLERSIGRVRVTSGRSGRGFGEPFLESLELGLGTRICLCRQRQGLRPDPGAVQGATRLGRGD